MHAFADTRQKLLKQRVAHGKQKRKIAKWYFGLLV